MTAEYVDFISSIGFHFIQPSAKVPKVYRQMATNLKRLGIYLDVVNTKLSEKSLKRSLYPLCKIDRMSTFAIGAMIHKGISLMPPGQAFVNVGVWNGFTLLVGMINNPNKKCIGIDNFSEFGGPRENFLKTFHRYKSEYHHFFDMDYQKYFKEVHQDPIGFYIYDGPHSYEHQMNGLKLAEPFFADGCIILVDDTNVPHIRQSIDDFIAGSAHRYKILFEQHPYERRHPTFWSGITLFQKIG